MSSPYDAKLSALDSTGNLRRSAGRSGAQTLGRSSSQTIKASLTLDVCGCPCWCASAATSPLHACMFALQQHPLHTPDGPCTWYLLQ